MPSIPSNHTQLTLPSFESYFDNLEISNTFLQQNRRPSQSHSTSSQSSSISPCNSKQPDISLPTENLSCLKDHDFYYSDHPPRHYPSKQSSPTTQPLDNMHNVYASSDNYSNSSTVSFNPQESLCSSYRKESVSSTSSSFSSRITDPWNRSDAILTNPIFTPSQPFFDSPQLINSSGTFRKNVSDIPSITNSFSSSSKYSSDSPHFSNSFSLSSKNLSDTPPLTNSFSSSSKYSSDSPQFSNSFSSSSKSSSDSPQFSNSFSSSLKNSHEISPKNSLYIPSQSFTSKRSSSAFADLSDADRDILVEMMRSIDNNNHFSIPGTTSDKKRPPLLPCQSGQLKSCENIVEESSRRKSYLLDPLVTPVSTSLEADTHSFLHDQRMTQRIRMASGRVVSFSEVGDRDGWPVFMHFGMGCSRYFAAFFDDLASSYNLRIIAIDRPGVGFSDDVHRSQLKLLNWPDVIEQVANVLDIEKFSLLAHSAGCPFALAVALKLQNRVLGTIQLLAPWAPLSVIKSFRWIKYVPSSVIKMTNSAGIKTTALIVGKPHLQKRRGSTKDVEESFKIDQKRRGSTKDFEESFKIDQKRRGSTKDFEESLKIDQKRRGSTKDFEESLKIDQKRRGSTKDFEESQKIYQSSPSQSPNSSVTSLSLTIPPTSISAPTSPTRTVQRKKSTPLLNLKKSFKNLRAKASEDTSTNEEYIPPLPSSISPSLSKELALPLSVAILRASYSESLSTGANNDLMTIFERHHPFGFSYSDIKQRVHIYHGTEDDRIPLTAAQWMVENMSNCSLTTLEGEGHHLMMRPDVMNSVLRRIGRDVHQHHKCKICDAAPKRTGLIFGDLKGFCWYKEIFPRD